METTQKAHSLKELRTIIGSPLSLLALILATFGTLVPIGIIIRPLLRTFDMMSVGLIVVLLIPVCLSGLALYRAILKSADSWPLSLVTLMVAAFYAWFSGFGWIGISMDPDPNAAIGLMILPVASLAIALILLFLVTGCTETRGICASFPRNKGASTTSILRAAFFVSLAAAGIWLGFTSVWYLNDFSAASSSHSEASLRSLYRRHEFDKRKDILLRLARNPRLPADILDQMARTAGPEVLFDIALHPNTGEATLEYIRVHGGPNEKIALAGRK